MLVQRQLQGLNSAVWKAEEDGFEEFWGFQIVISFYIRIGALIPSYNPVKNKISFEIVQQNHLKCLWTDVYNLSYNGNIKIKYNAKLRITTF